MSTQQTAQVEQETPLADLESAPYARPMYAIAFDLDTTELAVLHPATGESWKKAYREIKDALGKHGFERQQGSVYFGDENVTSVTCVLAVQDLAYKFSWFAEAVRDIRMLRIEEHNDLSIAIPSKV
jgi:virulence-associated protein VapD